MKSCPCKKASQYCSIECHPGYSCTNCRAKDSSGSIDLSKEASPAPSAMSWVVVGGVTLYEEHRLILSSPEEWLKDDIIRASQNLLKEQFPLVGGLQAPALAEKNVMEPQSGEFVQILCVGQNHWITLSTIGCPQGLVKVYDSLHGKLPSTSKRVIADLMMTRDKAIEVTYAPVQCQSGGSDCGLYALAFATSLCAGKDPVMITYIQPQMRSHLVTCLTKAAITSFPQRSSSRRVRIPTTRSELIPVYCVCRLPDDGGVMIQYTSCEEWFHRGCIQLPAKYVKNKKLAWNCRDCHN